nr:VCBS repeat-containing protein [Actinomycetota bacterium]
MSGQRLRAYALRYATSASGERSRLVEVQQYGRDAILAGGVVSGGTALPSARLGWQSAATSMAYGATFTLTPTGGQGIGRWNQPGGDFDGDGLTDIVRTTYDATGQSQVLFSNGDGTFRYGPKFTLTPTGGVG